MKRYVVGLAFDKETRNSLILINKTRGPHGIKGRLNGPGGNIEKDETVYEAVTREFMEETGVNVHVVEWNEIVILEKPGKLELRYFVAFLEKERISSAQSITDEIVDICTWPFLGSEVLATDLEWIIPLAAGFQKAENTYVVKR